MATIKRFLRAFVTDDQGRVVIAQPPNGPLIGWLVLWPASALVALPSVHNFLAFFSAAFLFTWAYLELTQGVNYFRRTLGAIVMIYMVVSRVLWGE